MFRILVEKTSSGIVFKMADEEWSDTNSVTQYDDVASVTDYALYRVEQGVVANYENMSKQFNAENVNHFITYFSNYEKLIEAAQKVKDSVPTFSSNDHSKVWKEQIIPSLTRSLTEYNQARSVILKVITKVRSFSIAVQKASEAVDAAQATPVAIKIAKKNISQGFQGLLSIKDEVSAIYDKSLEQFNKETLDLLHVLGNKPSKYNTAVSEYDLQRKELLVEIKAVTSQQTSMQDKINVLEDKIAKIAKKINGCKQIEAQQREQEEASNTSNAPTSSIPFLSLFKSRHSGNKPQFLPRTKRRTNQDELIQLEKDLLNNKRELQKSNLEYEMLVETSQIEMQRLKRQLAELNGKIENIEKSKTNTENRFGLQGKALEGCIADLHNYIIAVNSAPPVYNLLLSLLEGLQHTVQTDVDIITDPESTKEDVLVIGKLLTKHVEIMFYFLENMNKVFNDVTSKRINTTTPANKYFK